MDDLYNRTVIEAASWRLASTIVRRHQHLSLFNIHPAGGTYDVLTLRSEAGCSIMLNRLGTIQVHGRDDGLEPTVEPIEWRDYLAATDTLRFVTALESHAGLGDPSIEPPSPEALTYQTIASLACLGVLSEPFIINEGYFDSSGESGSFHTDWWEELLSAGIEQTNPKPSDVDGLAAYRFWRVRRHDFQLTLESSTATVWPEVDFDPGDEDESGEREVYAYGEKLIRPHQAMEDQHVGDRLVPPWPLRRLDNPQADARPVDGDPLLRCLGVALDIGRKGRRARSESLFS